MQHQGASPDCCDSNHPEIVGSGINVQELESNNHDDTGYSVYMEAFEIPHVF